MSRGTKSEKMRSLPSRRRRRRAVGEGAGVIGTCVNGRMFWGPLHVVHRGEGMHSGKTGFGGNEPWVEQSDLAGVGGRVVHGMK